MPFIHDSEGERYEEPNVSLARQQDYYNSHPPRILSEYKFERISGDDQFRIGGHGEIINKGYSLKCTCGHEAWNARSKQVDVDATIYPVSPVEIECSSCNQRSVLFDNKEHGSDAEHGYASHLEPALGEYFNLRDSAQGERLGIAVHYTDEGFEFDDAVFAEGGETGGPRPEDTFTWFTIVVMQNDGSIAPIFDCECA